MPETAAATAKAPIVLFDGVCHLCASAVQFILKHDPKGYFHFAPLQSPIGQQLLTEHQLHRSSLDTFVLIEDGRAYTRSTAALRVARRLSSAWPLCYAAIIIPAFLRDIGYDFIARHRYRWFGKSDTCMMPQPDWKRRFL